MIPEPDFSEVRGQSDAMDAIEDAVIGYARGPECSDAGGILLLGPPGTGRTMLARRIPSIMPRLDEHASRWLTAEYKALGLSLGCNPRRVSMTVLDSLEPVTERPFRAPHHTISQTALVGAAPLGHALDLDRAKTKPACRCGKLVNGACCSTRYPAARSRPRARSNWPGSGCCSWTSSPSSRSSPSTRWPARSRACPRTRATSCPCGFRGLGPEHGRCTCSEGAIKRHHDRVAMMTATLWIKRTAHVQHVSLADMCDMPAGESSAAIRERVEHAVLASGIGGA